MAKYNSSLLNIIASLKLCGEEVTESAKDLEYSLHLSCPECSLATVVLRVSLFKIFWTCKLSPCCRT